MSLQTLRNNPAATERHQPSLPPVVLIVGPTASGKSMLALELAAALGGTIVNGDALQVYRDLRVLSARPDAAAEARAPHRLYGYMDAAERGSVGQWREGALREIAASHAAGRLPIVVGGTGLYLRALQRGLAAMPPVPPAVRAEAAALHRVLGGDGFRERLRALDAVAAARLPAGDRQRLLRAFEIVRATGIPIGEWQARGQESAPYRFRAVLLLPPRAALYAAIDARFARMVEEGGLGEAAALLARGLDPELPAMKAVGVRELFGHLRGEMPLADAIAAGQRASRRYAKRQMTWFRHQMPADRVFAAAFSPGIARQAADFVESLRLTGRP